MDFQEAKKRYQGWRQQWQSGRVIAAYRSAFPDPLRLRAGDELVVGRKQSDWPGWVWCTTREGKSGWAPERHLDDTGDRRKQLTDYDATELTVQVGEILKLGEAESGWIWCTNREGKSGWVPVEMLEPLEPDV